MSERAQVRGTPAGPPRVIAQYELIKKLGRGGMADVYLGRHVLIGRMAAIKILHEAHARDASMRARFLNEARATVSIAHPNVVTLYEFGETPEGDAYLVMEYLQGETLGKRIKRKKFLGASEAARFAQEIAAGLAAVHARGVVHRDLKPSNVMIVQEEGVERVKVLDFGIAKMFEADDASGDLTRTGSVIGTPAFMSPEQCRGTGAIDQRSDVYSLGVLMYLMVAGRPPFQSSGAGEIIGMHLHVQPTPPSAHNPMVPPSIEEIILRCMRKEPAERYQNMDALIHELEGASRRLARHDLVSSLPLAPGQPDELPGPPETLATVAQPADSGELQIDSEDSGELVLVPDTSRERAAVDSEIFHIGPEASFDLRPARRGMWLVASVASLVLAAVIGVYAAWVRSAPAVAEGGAPAAAAAPERVVADEVELVAPAEQPQSPPATAPTAAPTERSPVPAETDRRAARAAASPASDDGGDRAPDIAAGDGAPDAERDEAPATDAEPERAPARKPERRTGPRRTRPDSGPAKAGKSDRASSDRASRGKDDRPDKPDKDRYDFEKAVF